MKKSSIFTIGAICIITIVAGAYLIPAKARADGIQIPFLNYMPQIQDGGNIIIPTPDISNLLNTNQENTSNMHVSVNQQQLNGTGFTQVSINANGFTPNEKTLININPGYTYTIKADRFGNINFSKNYSQNSYIQNISVKGLHSHKTMNWNNFNIPTPSDFSEVPTI